jgi:transposase-like protein
MTGVQRAARRKLIAELVVSGAEPAAVARRYGLSLTTIYNACIEHDVPVRRQPGKDKTKGVRP